MFGHLSPARLTQLDMRHVDGDVRADLSVSERETLRMVAEEALVDRARFGGLGFVIATVGVLLGSTYGDDHPIVTLGLATAIAVSAGFRFVAARYSYAAFRLNLIFAACLWSAFATAGILLYGFTGPTLLISVVIAGSLGMVSVGSAIDRGLLRTRLVIKLGPPIVAFFIRAEVETIVLGVGFLAGGILMDRLAFSLHGDYWRSLRARLQLERRARLLEDASRKAEEATQAKSSFLASVSHELRTPLNGVIGMADLLRRTPLGTLQRRYAEIISSSAENLLTLINDILDMSKIEAGGIEVESVPFDLGRLVDDAAELLSLEAADKGLDLMVSHDVRGARWVYGDPARTRQVLINLISNAVKFTETGHVLVELLPGLGSEPGVRLAVADTGIGIAADTKGRIFEPFAQADASTTRRFGGTGLGLTISQGLIRAMGGQLRLESDVGRGSRFEVFLPLSPAEPDGDWSPESSLAGVSVLLLDDKPTRRSIVARTLRTLGAEVSAPVPLGKDDDTSAFDAVLVAATLGSARVRTLAENDAPVLLLSRERVVLDDWVADVVAQPFAPTELSAVLRRTLASSGRDEMTAEAPSPLPLPERRFNARVLVVEDNAVNRMVAKQFLTAMGCEVFCVPDGARAVEATELQTFDLILMDCQMPVLDGFEATKTIRSAEDGRRTPIVAMTASQAAEDRTRAFEAGMDDWVEKPVRPERLADVLSLLDSRPRPGA